LLSGKAIGNPYSIFLTAEEKAHLYHVVMKSPVLHRNIGQFFEYSGDVIKHDTVIDYDAIEQKIIYEPSLLHIDMESLSKTSPGILAEAASKLALWVLHRELKRRHEPSVGGISDVIYNDLLQEITSNLPEKAMRKKRGRKELITQLDPLLDPNMSMNNKIITVNTAKLLTFKERKQVLDAINNAFVNYIEKTSFTYYEKLGGRSKKFQNMLLAAGDGSGTAGLLDEREKDERGRFNRGASKGVGLFTYDVDLATNEGVQEFTIKKNPIKTFSTVGSGKTTNAHLSIWGFNAYFQTTVVVTKGEKSYILYASKKHKELSPDSAFGGGKTYHQLLKVFEEETIGEIEHRAYGEGELKSIWEAAKADKSELIEKIAAKEKEITLLDKNRKDYEKRLQSKRNSLLRLRSSLPKKEEKIEAARQELDAVETKLKGYQDILNEMKSNLGKNVQNYTILDNVFTFEDGSVFDANTQDFKFADTHKKEKFEVRLIAIGSRALSRKVDEVQLYINVAEGSMIKKQLENISLELKDVFEPDEFILDQLNINTATTAQLEKLVKYIAYNDIDINISLKGHGRGIKQGNKVIPDPNKNNPDLETYPGVTPEEQQAARQSDAFRPLRVSNVIINAGRTVEIDIASFTDPVQSLLSEKILTEKVLYNTFLIGNVNNNTVLSALRSFNIFEKLLVQLVETGKRILPEEVATPYVAKLRKVYATTTVQIGEKELDLMDYSRLCERKSPTIIPED
jgi:hypothetical protein